MRNGRTWCQKGKRKCAKLNAVNCVSETHLIAFIEKLAPSIIWEPQSSGLNFKRLIYQPMWLKDIAIICAAKSEKILLKETESHV